MWGSFALFATTGPPTRPGSYFAPPTTRSSRSSSFFSPSSTSTPVLIRRDAMECSRWPPFHRRTTTRSSGPGEFFLRGRKAGVVHDYNHGTYGPALRRWRGHRRLFGDAEEPLLARAFAQTTRRNPSSRLPCAAGAVESILLALSVFRHRLSRPPRPFEVLRAHLRGRWVALRFGPICTNLRSPFPDAALRQSFVNPSPLGRNFKNSP